MVGARRRALIAISWVLFGLGIALAFRGVIARVDSGAGLSRMRSSQRCEAAPGCEEAMARVVLPGFVLLMLGAFILAKVDGRSMFSRRRVPVGGKVKLIRRTSTTTVTQYRSTWDGPAAEGQTTTRHESGDPLSPAEADHLIELLENPQSDVVVEGARSADEARQELAAMLGGRADVVVADDRSSRSSTRELSRTTSVGLLAAGATIALLYAQLVL